jgi:CubicO group peptidase (beta-lactamase class C family)
VTHPQFLQWSFQHAREIVPTARISRGSGGIAKLSENTRPLAELPVTPSAATATTVGAVLATTYTDGFLVLHDGAIVAEEYPGGMAADTLHLLMSVTKSLVGSVAAVLVDRGRLDPAALVTQYVPALAASGYAGAIVRHLLDMRSGVIFSEDYTDPNSGIRRLRQCVGWNSQRDPAAPASIYDFLVTLRQGSPHGGAFAYRSCETDTLGWVCEQAGGRRMPELISELLWSRLGVEHDADISIDAAGIAVHDGGMSATVRDLARFGHMLAQYGRSATGEQVLPEWWVRDCLTGDPDSRQAFAASTSFTGMPGGMYRNQLWVPYPDRDVLVCLGIHGQLVYVDPAARMVGVKLSSWPVPQDPAMLAATLQAFATIARHLEQRR